MSNACLTETPPTHKQIGKLNKTQHHQISGCYYPPLYPQTGIYFFSKFLKPTTRCGTSIALMISMKLLLISSDPDLVNGASNAAAKNNFELINFNESNDPLDILSSVCSTGPNAIIFDDDYLPSQSSAILKSIRKVNKKVAVIFVTSNNSIELGRDISNLGIQFYGLKPIPAKELNDLLESIPSLVKKYIN